LAARGPFGPPNAQFAYRVAIVIGFRQLGLPSIAVLTLLGLGLGACGGGDEPSVSAPDVALDTVSIGEPGEGDATQLRWEPTSGETAHFEVTIGADTVVEIDDIAQEAMIGPARVGFDAVVVSVGSAGEITTEYRLTIAAVPDDLDPTLDAAMKRLIGTVVVDVVSSQGLPISRLMTPPEPLGAAEQAQLERFVDQLSLVFAPLPTESVAKGATWTYARSADAQAVTWIRATTYRLDERDGSALDLQVQLAQYAEFQEVDPTGPINLEGTIAGAGTLRADLKSLTPRDFHSRTELEAAIYTRDERTGRTANETETSLISVDSGP
jgi:hypothetical protein